MPSHQQPQRPWLMRTYSGHSSAQLSNELYRRNLAKGQTGLSVAFDLPTQTGYDSDHPLSRGEVGKVGVPINHIGDMQTLFNGIALADMNTSMTINATAPWLLALYIATAEQQGAQPHQLAGTIQNDIIKEYLSRGTYIFPPKPSLGLVTDTIAYTVKAMPRWNPINICSYHLQEAGATPIQELAYAVANATTVLDGVRAKAGLSKQDFDQVVGRISFFVNAGIRFIEELCKMRAFVQHWQQLTQQRYQVEDAKLRRFRYGVQVNSLGLTEPQPENNVQRIVLEMLAVTLSKDARARAVQLPAWNEALGLPRPWDQQWALRMQQVLAFETDLLEYDDIFNGSTVIEQQVNRLLDGMQQELDRIDQQGGFLAAVENGYIKRALVNSQRQRLQAIETKSQKLVGVNCFTEHEPSPLLDSSQDSILRIDPDIERQQIESLLAFRQQRDPQAVQTALQALVDATANGDNILPVSIACAKAGVTTGEWADALRGQFGEYRAPTGIDVETITSQDPSLVQLRQRVQQVGQQLGRPLRLLIGKPGLDGHSNGAEQIAVRARDAGFEVIYQGIRLTPKAIARTALEEGVHGIGLSILSGSHMGLTRGVMDELQQQGLDVPVFVGGIIPASDRQNLLDFGVAGVFSPQDSDLNQIMVAIVDGIEQAAQP